MIHASETVDLTPTSKVNLQHANHERNGRSIASYYSLGATIVDIDGLTVTLHMSEDDRANAYYVSGLSGGDGGAAFYDLTQAFLLTLHKIHLIVRHFILKNTKIFCILCYQCNPESKYGGIVLYFSETIDFTPLSQIDRRRINISDSKTLYTHFPSMLPKSTVKTLLWQNSAS